MHIHINLGFAHNYFFSKLYPLIAINRCIRDSAESGNKRNEVTDDNACTRAFKWRGPCHSDWVHLLIHFANRLYNRCLIDAFLIMCQFGHTRAPSSSQQATGNDKRQTPGSHSGSGGHLRGRRTKPWATNKSATKVNGKWPRRLIVHCDMRADAAQMRTAAAAAAAAPTDTAAVGRYRNIFAVANVVQLFLLFLRLDFFAFHSVRI